jgi:[ribosomal protein S18]-alanine N-acetyltransferase
MSLEIRSARTADLDALVAIEEAAFHADRLSRTGYRRLIARSSASVLIAEDNGAVAGCAVVLFRAMSRKARLYSIAAAPGRKGVGRTLLDGAEVVARQRGASAMRLEVREDNLRAINLYKSAGYRLFDRKPHYYADDAAAIRFEKALHETAGPLGGTSLQ